MENEENKGAVIDKEELDNNAKDIMKRAEKELKLSDAEAKKIIEEINKSFDFDGIIEELKKKYPLETSKYVIFTDGKEQLYYEDGEFFLISAVDSTKQKKKIKRKEALDLYNEYYITNVLNPLIRQKNKVEPKKEEKVQEEKLEKKAKQEKEKKKKQEDEIKEVKEEISKKTNEQSVEERLEELKAKEKKLKKKIEKSTKDNIAR